MYESSNASNKPAEAIVKVNDSIKIIIVLYHQTKISFICSFVVVKLKLNIVSKWHTKFIQATFII